MRATLTFLSDPLGLESFTKNHSQSQIIFQSGAKRLFMDDADGEIVFRSPDKLDQAGLQKAILDICNLAKAEKRTNLVFTFSNIAENMVMSDRELARVLGDYLVDGSYTFDTYKKDKDYSGLESITLDLVPEKFMSTLEESAVIGGAVTKAKDLCNTPANDLGPEELRDYASAITELGGGSVVNKTFDPDMPYGDDSDVLGLVIGVSQGSLDDPAFIVLEYRGDDSSEGFSVVAIGKGVTFDTGGLSMKSSDGMLGMHHDMGGAAAVLASFEAVVRLQLKVNIVAIVPAVENSVSQAATRPGDILTSMSGLTVEVGNTDAEGRLILADALSFAGKYYPGAKLYVDLATLTGAVGVALGSSYSGLFTTNDRLAEDFMGYADWSGDPLWRLPIGGEFEKLLDSKVADLNNVQSGASKNGGASIGASFLHVFARRADIADNHVHGDIASRMKGPDGLSQGAGTRLLIAVIQDFVAKT